MTENMKLNDQISEQFDDFSLFNIKSPKYKHYLYADFVELMALFGCNEYVVQDDLIKRVYFELQANSESEEEESLDDDEIGARTSEYDDKYQSWANNVFDILSEREELFESNYPFSLDKHGLILKKDLDNTQHLYLTLLLASSLNNFKILQKHLTDEFESISLEALRGFMPKHATIKSLGKNSEYKGSAKDKIDALAKDMGIDTNKAEIKLINDRNNQEEGLDIIAWTPFNDRIPNMITILGQCACGKNWKMKQSESPRYENFLVFHRLKPINALFVPYAWSNSEETFHESKDIANQLLVFDRKRIIDQISNLDFYDKMNVKKIVEEALKIQEELV